MTNEGEPFSVLALSLVTTGLDPVVHTEVPYVRASRQRELKSRMDCRVKPGNDELTRASGAPSSANQQSGAGARKKHATANILIHLRKFETH